ncbi:MAG: flagellar biosynthesis protein FlhB [Thermodesulfovibrionales bacterium]|nr:flagellar biosynthesis protein FlhB [Thermodesulfovibrionales bacterium]
MAEYQDKTEQATPRKKQKAREKGQVSRSRELISLVSMGGIILMLYIEGSTFVKKISELIIRLFSLSYGLDVIRVLQVSMMEMLFILMPFFTVAFAFSLFAGVIQGGFIIKPIKFELEKINPINGFRRIFSKEGLVELCKTMFKFIIGVLLSFLILAKVIFVAPSLISLEVNSINDIALDLITKVVIIVFLTFFVLAMLDYVFERWRFERSLRMSKEELKEEYKETEGDPLIKARIKSIQREIARKRMMQEVPKATVVITNPLHIAVALQYKRNEMMAPKVVAKGAGFIAEKIREIALKHNVPIVEDVVLARALFQLKVGSYIPAELYKAVAKIIAYIYKMKGVA